MAQLLLSFITFLMLLSVDIPLGLSLASSPKNILRRAFLDSAVVASFTLSTPSSQAIPTVPSFIGSPPMIQSYPSLQYLVPIYTFNLSLSYLANQLGSSTQEGIQVASKIVDKFFSGGLLSNKNIFRGMCAIYINEIRYDDPDRDRVYVDRVTRLQYCDSTINSLEKMQKPLAQLVAIHASSPSEQVMSYLESARNGLRNFLSIVPEKDIERVKSWIVTMKAADLDQDGKIDDSELEKLSDEDKTLFLAVGQML